MVELFRKECKMIARSLVYFIFIGVLATFYFTQFFPEVPITEAAPLASDTAKGKPPVQRRILQEPVYIEDVKVYFAVHHEYPYGTIQDEIAEQIIPNATASLFNEYVQGSYAAYPIGFAKNVKLNKTEAKKIEQIIEEITGRPIADIKEMYKDGKWLEVMSDIHIEYDRFKKLMGEANDIIGDGSNYSKENLLRFGVRPKTYEEAVKEYKELVYTDRITNGYARLFSDYLGIVLGLFPIFVVVFYMMRDKKSNMQPLIYYREISSFKLILSKFLALVSMMMLPVLALAAVSTVKFMAIGQSLKVSIDYLAFLKYSFGWLLPTVMAVTALGILLTVVTESVFSIIIQIVWFFAALFSVGLGGHYGIMHLIIRFNTPGDRQLFLSNINSILLNRVFYVALSSVFVAVSIFILNLKRVGRFDIYGKFREYASIVQGKFKGSLSE